MLGWEGSGNLAILDVNLEGKTITPVAGLIKARGRPIIFATACGSDGLPEEFRGLPELQKPFHLEALAALIDEVVHLTMTLGSRLASPGICGLVMRRLIGGSVWLASLLKAGPP